MKSNLSFNNWLEKYYINTIENEIIIFLQLVEDKSINNFYKKKFEKYKEEILKVINQDEELKSVIQENKELKDKIYYFFLHKYLIFEKFKEIYNKNKKVIYDILLFFINIKNPKENQKIFYIPFTEKLITYIN